jgi:hypothetical protein
MSNTNKPDWLIKAEEEQAKFNQSKYGSMTEKQLISCEAGVKGGKKTAKRFTSDYQANASKSRSKEVILNSTSAAGFASGILKKEKTENYIKKLYSLIVLDQFTINDIKHLYKEFDHLKDDQMIRIWIKNSDMFEQINTSIKKNKVYKKK